MTELPRSPVRAPIQQSSNQPIRFPVPPGARAVCDRASKRACGRPFDAVGFAVNCFCWTLAFAAMLTPLTLLCLIPTILGAR
jgi:hypothetical protein